MGQSTKDPIYICESVLQQVMDFIEESLYLRVVFQVFTSKWSLFFTIKDPKGVSKSLHCLLFTNLESSYQIYLKKTA